MANKGNNNIATIKYSAGRKDDKIEGSIKLNIYWNPRRKEPDSMRRVIGSLMVSRCLRVVTRMMWKSLAKSRIQGAAKKKKRQPRYGNSTRPQNQKGY